MVIQQNMSKKNFWKKEKLEEIYFSKKILTERHTHASGSGDGGSVVMCCCRLCSADHNLRSITDTCLWEGVEARFDRVLFDCFGVQVTPGDCKICDRCVSQLMITYKFRALVQAAFIKTCSISDKTQLQVTSYRQKSGNTDENYREICIDTSPSSVEAIIDSSPTNLIESFADLGPQDNSNQIINKKILDILTQKISQPPKKVFKRSVVKMNNSPPKKTIVSCSNCGQKYPLMVVGVAKEFVCSRCKLKRNTNDLKKWNVFLKKNENVKADFRPKGRLSNQVKKPSQVNNLTSNTIDCSPKNFLKQIKAANYVKPCVKQQFKMIPKFK